MMRTRSRQNGAVLVVGLVMLVMLTLFAISAINTSTSNLKIAGNLQAQIGATAAGQRAIEAIVTKDVSGTYASDIYRAPKIFFQTPIADPPAVDVVVGGVTYTVDVATPDCLGLTPPEPGALCGAAGAVLCPDNTNWDIQATVTEKVDVTGVRVVATQGVRVPLAPGGVTCPTPLRDPK